MVYALMASLFLNGLLIGIIVGVAKANEGEGGQVSDVPGGGIQVAEDPDYDYSAPTIGFKGMNGK